MLKSLWHRCSTDMTQKNEQRRQMRTLRNTLTHSEAMEKSRAVFEKFVCMDFYKNAETVMIYLSAKNEVDTLLLAARIIADGKRLVVPVTNADNTLTLSYLESLDELVEGAYGIPEPKMVCVCPDSEIDVVVVPGLVFDRRGGRIGYGKGYYDRVFARLDAVRIAFCYDFQLVENAAVEEHDVPMDYIVTESVVIDCGEK